jgi:4-oxalocrotonate tautomerase
LISHWKEAISLFQARPWRLAGSPEFGGIGRKFMPLVQIKVFEGVLSEEKKREMIERVTEVVAEIEARPYPMEKLLPYTWCVIEEVPAQNWGIGGQPSNLELLKALLESE